MKLVNLCSFKLIYYTIIFFTIRANQAKRMLAKKKSAVNQKNQKAKSTSSKNQNSQGRGGVNGGRGGGKGGRGGKRR